MGFARTPFETNLKLFNFHGLVPLFGVLIQTNPSRNWRWFKGDQLGTAPIDTTIQVVSQICWESLESKRTKLQLVMIYKIMNDLVDIPADTYLTPATTRTRAIHSKKLRQYPTRTDTFKYSFFPRTIPVWNSLPASVAEAPDLALFKQGLTSLSF